MNCAIFHNPTRERVSEGQMREGVASDVNPSLTYVSGRDGIDGATSFANTVAL
jgi:hypothetical protein